MLISRYIKEKLTKEGVHTDTSASPATRIEVPVNTSLYVFQW